MLALENLTIDVGGFRLRTDLQIPKAKRVAVIGSSGAGKSTLLSAIAGFQKLTSGKMIWCGGDISDQPPGQRPISMLFQDGNLFPHLDIAANVGLGLRPDLKLRSDQRDEVAYALDAVGLSGFGARLPAELSGGQQSRAALARVLVQKRPLILLDEPFAALGPALKNEMLDLVQDVQERNGATLLMVSHDPADAQRIAPLSILVADGQATGSHDTKTLLSDPPDSLRSYLG